MRRSVSVAADHSAGMFSVGFLFSILFRHPWLCSPSHGCFLPQPLAAHTHFCRRTRKDASASSCKKTSLESNKGNSVWLCCSNTLTSTVASRCKVQKVCFLAPCRHLSAEYIPGKFFYFFVASPRNLLRSGHFSGQNAPCRAAVCQVCSLRSTGTAARTPLPVTVRPVTRRLSGSCTACLSGGRH